jgi:hypothetical protein
MMRDYKGDFVAIGLDCKGAKQNFLDTSTNVARYGKCRGSQERFRFFRNRGNCILLQ